MNLEILGIVVLPYGDRKKPTQKREEQSSRDSQASEDIDGVSGTSHPPKYPFHCMSQCIPFFHLRHFELNVCQKKVD